MNTNMADNKELYEPGICRECGKGLPKVKEGNLQGQKELKALAANLMHLCRRCYEERFPERAPRLPAQRWFHNRKWVDLKPLTPGFRENPYVRAGEPEEVEESQQLLPEEKDDADNE